jgi:hypothetical protein
VVASTKNPIEKVARNMKRNRNEKMSSKLDLKLNIKTVLGESLSTDIPDNIFYQGIRSGAGSI